MKEKTIYAYECWSSEHPSLMGLNQSGFQAFFSDSLQIHSDIPGTHF